MWRHDPTALVGDSKEPPSRDHYFGGAIDTLLMRITDVLDPKAT